MNTISKIKNEITLDDRDMMKLIFAPLTHKDDKKATVEHVNKILDLINMAIGLQNTFDVGMSDFMIELSERYINGEIE